MQIISNALIKERALQSIKKELKRRGMKWEDFSEAEQNKILSNLVEKSLPEIEDSDRIFSEVLNFAAQWEFLVLALALGVVGGLLVNIIHDFLKGYLIYKILVPIIFAFLVAFLFYWREIKINKIFKKSERVWKSVQEVRQKKKT